ncbi:hypothetical protein M8J77_004137 [Diaphorina citri]|nr:hypothetical protein M8J77_004137 [Diaphorina citri]
MDDVFSDFSVWSGISSSSSGDSSPESVTQDDSPSVVIVNSGTGGIVWRNRTDDDESFTTSSSVGTLDDDNARDGRDSPQHGERYFLRNRNQRRRRRRQEAASSNDTMSVVSVSSDTQSDEDIHLIPHMDSEPDDDGSTQSPMPVPPSPPPSSLNSIPQNHPEPVNPSVQNQDAAGVVVLGVEVPSTPVRTSEKRKHSSPVSKKARLDDSQEDEDGVDVGCNICYDSYTAVGPHRPVCLKCGHIFGFSCVERWLKVSCSNGNRRCPTCNKKASLKDIRYLYCCNLRAVDNTRVHQLTTELEKEKIQNSKYKVEITTVKIKMASLEKELNHYKGLEKQGLLHQKELRQEELSSKVPVFYMSIALCKNSTGTLGLARSLVYDETKKLLLATHQTDTHIFSGFGYSLLSLQVVNRASPPVHKFYLMSQKTIRDVMFHPQDSDLLLIVSLDKTAKLIDVRTGTRIYTFHTDYALWSCAWDQTNPNLFLVGGVNGQLARFDKRQTAWQHPIATGGTNVGVVSIIGVKAGPGRGLPRGGFLVCKLNAVLALESTALDNNAYEDSLELLDTDGPFMSMSYLSSKNQVLLSSRPAAASPNIRHRVFTLDQSPDGKPVLSLIQTILGGSLAPSLTRSYIWPEQVAGHSLVYAYDAASKCLCGWSVSDAGKKVSLPCSEPLLDICRVEAGGEIMLAALSDAAVLLFKHP